MLPRPNIESTAEVPELVDESGNPARVRALTRGEVTHPKFTDLASRVDGGDLAAVADLEKLILGWALDAEPAAIDAWYAEIPAAAVDAVIRVVQRISGLDRPRSAGADDPPGGDRLHRFRNRGDAGEDVGRGAGDAR